MKQTAHLARCAFVAGALALPSRPRSARRPPASRDCPQPKILVIDRAAILRVSKVGQDIVTQVQALCAARPRTT